MAISVVTRQAIARIWEGPGETLGDLIQPVGYWTGDLNEVEFLERLYPLADMPSDDPRYPNARDDILQHCVANPDLDGFWVLTDARFGLDDDKRLLRLLAETVHPEVRLDGSACRKLVDRYNEALRRDGVELAPSGHISGRPLYEDRRYTPTATEVRDALANAIAELKAYNVRAFCTKVGVGPDSSEFGDPDSGKFKYVQRRAMAADLPQLLKAARATLAEIDDDHLRSIVEAATTGGGVASPPKNLIFAANGPKPELVLRDAISNDIEITKHAEFCLVYNRPVSDDGLTWEDMVDWWRSLHPAEDDSEKSLYERLKASLAPNSPGEAHVFRIYNWL